MKTNLLTSLLNKARTALCPGAQPNSPASPERRGGGTGAGWYTRLQAALNNKTAIRFAKYLIPITILLLFFLLLSLTSCKTPATLTNNESHHTRDSNYHATVHGIETHDTIVLGLPLNYHKKYCRDSNGKAVLEPFAGGNLLPDYLPLISISDRKITIRDTVFIARTDTLLRTQTITQKERYIPPFYRFCTITLATLATFATLAFSIHLLLRYLKTR